MSKTEQRTKQRMVFVGMRATKTKATKLTKRYVWHDVEDGELREHVDAERHFAKQIQTGAAPGAVYDVEVKEGGSSIFVNSGTYVGRFDDEDKVVEWTAAHRAATAACAAQSKANTERRERLDLKRLEPFRLAYANANAKQKQLILADIMAAVTSYKELK